LSASGILQGALWRNTFSTEKDKGKGKGITASSAGTNPAGEVNRTAVELMKEKGIDISKKKPTLLTPEMIDEADLIITMGCGVEESCPVILEKPTKDWGLEDPHDMQREKFIRIVNEIERRVLQLIDDLKRGGIEEKQRRN